MLPAAVYVCFFYGIVLPRALTRGEVHTPKWARATLRSGPGWKDSAAKYAAAAFVERFSFGGSKFALPLAVEFFARLPRHQQALPAKIMLSPP